LNLLLFFVYIMKNLHYLLPFFCLLAFYTSLSYSYEESYYFPTGYKNIKENRTPYLLSIKVPESINSTKDVSCVYHGNHVMFQDNYCTINETNLRSFFSLVITPSIEFKDNGGYLEDTAQCKWYNLTLHFKDPEPESQKRYYYCSIIVQLPADFIEKLEELPIKGPLAIHLPQIVLKDSLTQQAFSEALEEIAFGLLDLKVRCRPPCLSSKRQETHVVTQTEVRPLL
jgi:hypothetical protein